MTLNHEKLLRIKDVTQITGLSKSYIYALCKQNKFPKPVSIIKGGTAVAWIESEINDYVKSRIETRNKAELKNA